MVKIIGAGMAGLLAGNMMRHRSPIIYERQDGLPNNHSAVLRFRSGIVGEVLGIPFKKVRVTKTVIPWRNPVADSLSYSFKVIGKYRNDRSIMSGSEVVDRYIAPPNLIERMAERVEIKFGVEFDIRKEKEKVVSTIPMSHLQIMLNYPRRNTFEYVPGLNIRAKIKDCDAYASIYVPDPAVDFYRASITGDELIIECTNRVGVPTQRRVEDLMIKAAQMLGIAYTHFATPDVKAQTYSKIVPIDETARREFIFWASSMMNKAYSLGRYATWRPGLLMDDVVKDVRMIESWMDAKSPGYEMDLHNARKVS